MVEDLIRPRGCSQTRYWNGHHFHPNRSHRTWKWELHTRIPRRNVLVDWPYNRNIDSLYPSFLPLLLAHTDVFWRILTYSDVFWRILTYLVVWWGDEGVSVPGTCPCVYGKTHEEKLTLFFFPPPYPSVTIVWPNFNKSQKNWETNLLTQKTNQTPWCHMITVHWQTLSFTNLPDSPRSLLQSLDES